MRYVILFVVLGLFLGIGLSQAQNAGYFERWQKLETPPVKVVELITSGKGTVFARAADGETYRCTDWRGECWLLGEVYSFANDPYPTTVTKPCNFSSPEFFPLAGPPKGIVDCIHDETIYADGWGEQTYVLDTDGIVWEWSHGGTVYSSGGGDIFCSCLGMLLGLVLGGGIMWQRRNSRRVSVALPESTDESR